MAALPVHARVKAHFDYASQCAGPNEPRIGVVNISSLVMDAPITEVVTSVDFQVDD